MGLNFQTLCGASVKEIWHQDLGHLKRTKGVMSLIATMEHRKR